jgi:hypothetical protein
MSKCLFVTSECPSNKVDICPIRVNAMLTFDRVKPKLFYPWWIPHGCHVGWLDANFYYIQWSMIGASHERREREEDGCTLVHEGCIPDLEGTHSSLRGVHELMWAHTGAWGAYTANSRVHMDKYGHTQVSMDAY